DSFHVTIDEKLHVVHRLLDVVFLRDFLALLEDRLDNLRASACASAMNAIATASMMRAEFLAGHVEYRLAHLPAQRRFQDIDRSGDGNGRALSLQKIDERFAFGRHLLAQVKEGVVSVEPRRVIVRARDSSPDCSFGFPK